MAIEAEALNLGDLFLRGVFEPARVQRDYQWTDKEWRELLIDLEVAFKRAGFDPDPDHEDPADMAPGEESDALDETPPESGEVAEVAMRPLREASIRAVRVTYPQDYFLGPMVLQPRAQTKDSYFIFDGQQRLTTLSLLFAALRDRLSEQAESWLDLQEMLRTHDERRMPRLNVTTPGGALARITGYLGGTHFQGRYANRSLADRLMYGAAEYFANNTAHWSDAKRRDFLTFLRRNVYVTVTFISDRKLAETAYHTVNTRGLGLRMGDIIKGHIVQIVAGKSAMRGNEVADKWDQLRNQARNRFEDLLRAVDFILFGKHRTNDFGDDLMAMFEGEDGDVRAYDWVMQSLPMHLQNFLPLFEHERLDQVTGLNLSLRQLSFLRWKEWQPVAMAMVNRHAKHPADLESAIGKLQRSCYIMHLLAWSDRPERRCYALSSAIDEIDANRSPFRQRTSTLEAGPLYFRNDRRSQARGALSSPMPEDDFHGPIVRWIETLLWDELAGPSRMATNGSSVEHVLPRAHGEQWTQTFPNEDERETCKNLLGNFCLLPRDVDYQVSNKGFVEKRAVYISLNTRYRSAHEVAAHLQWTPDAVRQRTERLAQIAERALGIVARSARAGSSISVG